MPIKMLDCRILLFGFLFYVRVFKLSVMNLI
jgi:hypothetical protein